MADKSHILTDEKLEEMERHLSAIYSRAQKDIQKKADEYFDKFKKADEEKRKLVKQGKLTDEEYKKWRQNKIMYGKRFTAMKEDVAKQLLNVNQTATAYINGELPEIYTLNYNALADTVDGVAITCISIETTLQVNIVCTEHHVEVVAVRWFQTRVTLCNVQWVRVISDVKQVGH